jgi:hypothetical protein
LILVLHLIIDCNLLITGVEGRGKDLRSIKEKGTGLFLFVRTMILFTAEPDAGSDTKD